MKLNWKLKRNGDEVAGPFVVLDNASGTTKLMCDILAYWTTSKTRAQAKRAAQRIADKILRNVGVKP